MKIGVFDSGVGGITVLNEIYRCLTRPGKTLQALRKVEFVYLGDTAHVPYGPKSPSQIESLSVDCARILKNKGVDLLVVACNTASSWALPAIQKVMGKVPVMGVVEAGVKAATDIWLEESRREGEPRDVPILVLATRATVSSGTYRRLIGERFEALDEFPIPPQVLEQACPLLVPMIEEGWVDHPILKATLQEYVKPHLARHKSGIALLGCTHYPWLQKEFELALPGFKVINSAQAIAEQLEGVLRELVVQKRRNKAAPKKSLQHKKVEWLFTDPNAIPTFAKETIAQLAASSELTAPTRKKPPNRARKKAKK